MKFSRTLSLILLCIAAYYSISSLMPKYHEDSHAEQTEFSVDKALKHVKELSKETHSVGFIGHKHVRSYLVKALKELGLETYTQEGQTVGDWGNLSTAINIMAKIPGSDPNGKSLVLLSHYDSNPHSSLGASDAASGVATILEGVRAYLASNKKAKNDIILLFTDAEELGLNGADLFVREHPWAKNVGLVLNFEARGSGGPSYMLIETNRGNAKLIQEFTKAHPKYPVTNSLAYSIYKLLPNDTDLTVFREKGDIDGFNFAFIDDHFDYHTALDTYERLDKKTLKHQGTYLMPLLDHFSNADLTNVKSLTDYVYFNFPLYNMVSYPFDWIWPLFLGGVFIFFIVLTIGFKKSTLNALEIAKGFLPMLITLLVNGAIGYFTWSALQWWYPWYRDILHGFTYNGHDYIWVVALLALTVCFFVYNRFKFLKTQNLLIAPIALWLVLCGLTAYYLKGASFFILPVFGAIASLYVLINQEKPSPFILLFLALPAVFLYVPFIKMFPVGLGLKMLVAATVFVTLLYFLLVPLFGNSGHKMRFAVLSVTLFLIFSIKAHLNSSYSPEHPKPSSLLYVLNSDTQQAQWATYDNVLTHWNSQFVKDKNDSPETGLKTISSKYNTSFTYVTPTEVKAIPAPEILVTQDSIIENTKQVTLCIYPNRNVNRLELFTNDVKITRAIVNDQELTEAYLAQRNGGRLFTHHITDNAYTEVKIEYNASSKLEVTLYEASNDLLEHELFTVPDRPIDEIPMPFVLNDAILVVKKIKIE
ncbi:M20/M25/M40 family metallo-hydrolase [Flavobacterium sp. ASW18X]|uniref:M20/M25/M40 family metallo-hydrolase n=1 Tax=Flavobacterium sp. ASW18X TaxID=2572595 RepID=UPI0010ADB6CE|nr:M20/M25/M40 family metallo-hydrolase [Flavobacterium sp. ASW18X]TKD67014.1 M20/M25/M40 family metallo-hydrolase [Flavobacterium sp. ASW18X]